jgi:hypothetical protein
MDAHFNGPVNKRRKYAGRRQLTTTSAQNDRIQEAA